jgi:hypothetical protein
VLKSMQHSRTDRCLPGPAFACPSLHPPGQYTPLRTPLPLPSTNKKRICSTLLNPPQLTGESPAGLQMYAPLP